MLHGLVGDSAFFRGIREDYRVYRDSTALWKKPRLILPPMAVRAYAIDNRVSIAYLEMDEAPRAIRIDPEGRCWSRRRSRAMRRPKGVL